MVARGLWLAGVMLAAAALAAPAVSPAPANTCGPIVAQDDADSNRDAGNAPASAVPLTEERRYDAAIGYPAHGAVDGEDWFTATWNGENGPDAWDVMVEVRTATVDHLYGHVDGSAAHLDLAAYAPGADEPTYTGERTDEGTVVMDFETETPGTWHFQVLLEDSPSTVDSCGSSAPGGQAPVDTYKLYWGCDPHCVQVQ